NRGRQRSSSRSLVRLSSSVPSSLWLLPSSLPSPSLLRLSPLLPSSLPPSLPAPLVLARRFFSAASLLVVTSTSAIPVWGWLFSFSVRVLRQLSEGKRGYEGVTRRLRMVPLDAEASAKASVAKNERAEAPAGVGVCAGAPACN